MNNLSRFKAGMMKRFFLRFHMSIILMVVIVSGVLFNNVLYGFILSPAVRYPVAVAASYATYFAMIKLWLTYIRTVYERDGKGFEPDGDSSVDLSHVGCGSHSSGGFHLDVDGEAAIAIVVLLLIVFAVGGASLYLIYEAPMILTEAACQTLLTATVMRETYRIDRPNWIGSVFRATIVPFVSVAVVACLAGLLLSQHCHITRLSDECVTESNINHSHR